MIFFLLSCLSFIFISMSFSHRRPLPWRNDGRLVGPWFWEHWASSLICWLYKTSHDSASSFLQVPTNLQSKKATLGLKRGHGVEAEKVIEGISLLDLPELALDCIFQQLSPAELCCLGGVCAYLREKCRSDHLWKKHMEEKWGRVIGDRAYREFQWFLASSNRRKQRCMLNEDTWRSLLFRLWPFSVLFGRLISYEEPESNSLLLRVDSNSIMAWYISIETGKFWFPAQVFNRENGHVGFMLSCYDADLCYDSHTKTFRARYGRQSIEESVGWDRVRAAPDDTPPAHVLHVSDCLNELKPGDHIEIQWRRNKEFPYGWWYGVIGHMECCDSDEMKCDCHKNGKVMVEFKQYRVGSRWRRMRLERRVHREEGNEGDGFYGGVRKLCKEDGCISRWNGFWPKEVLD